MREMYFINMLSSILVLAMSLYFLKKPLAADLLRAPGRGD